MHKREQIRNAAATAVTGLTTTGANVFLSRVHAMPDKVLPGLLVYAETEESERDAAGGGLERTLNLAIDGRAKSGEDIDDVLDDIAEEVEAAMDADPTLSGLCLTSFLASTEIGFSGEGRRRAGSVKMIFEIFYTT